MEKLFKIIICAAIAAAASFTCAYADEISPSEAPAAIETEAPEATENPDAAKLSAETEAPTETEAPDVTVLPAETEAPAAVPKADTLDFKIEISDKKYVVDSFIKLEVYDGAGALVGTERAWVGGITKSVGMHFDVPEYELGDSFTVKLVEGAESLQYYNTKIIPGGSFEIKTSFYTENGAVVPYNSYIFTAVPLWEKEVVIYVNNAVLKTPTRARIIDGSTLVPVRSVAEAMGIDVRYDARYDSVVCSVGDNEIIYNLGTAYATFFGKDINLPAAPRYIDGNTYVPVRPLAEAFGADIEALDFGDHMDVVIGESSMVREYYLNNPVNKWNISSRTDYMVWVSKSEYTVRVYEGSKNKWKLIYTAPCAIGAPGTPTITGSFEYIERTRWDYGTYYVAPVLRFYNGYALHSTLLYYGGGEYDGRVGVKISHGCIRMHPQDINWISNTIPLYTRIYITE